MAAVSMLCVYWKVGPGPTTRVRQVRRDQTELDPTESGPGRRRRYDRVARGARLTPTRSLVPCRTLGAVPWGGGCPLGGAHPAARPGGAPFGEVYPCWTVLLSGER